MRDRLTNCDNALTGLLDQTDDEEIRAEIRNVLSPIRYMLTELDDPLPDTDKECEAVIQATMIRIKRISEEIAGSPTMRSTDLSDRTPKE